MNTQNGGTYMFIDIQLFGGGGGANGGSYKGSAKPPSKYKANSKYTQYKNGTKYQERWYDKNGNPKKDRDYTNHGNPKKHPKVPHDHDWNDGHRGNWY